MDRLRNGWGDISALMAATSAPEFGRSPKFAIEEAELVRRVLAEAGCRVGTMVDVGGHFGTVSVLFSTRGWEVHAFEPDPGNRLRFRERFDEVTHVHLDPRAVSETDGEHLTFYSSPQSTGISGLVNFHETHQPLTEVTTVRLDTYLASAGVPAVDFLKVDTEGFDLFVVRSFGWGEMPAPAAVLCEFEDAKTTNVGYTTDVLADFLESQGYTVLVSEWHPIERYGVAHSWKTLRRWDRDAPPSADSWGNLIGFLDPQQAEAAFSHLPDLVTAKASVPLADRLTLAAWKNRTARLRSAQVADS